MKKAIDLNGVWNLRWHDDERGDRAQRLNEGTAALDRAWKARVPGSVHGTLLEHGVIDDPHVGANVLKCRWVEEMFWNYHRTFSAPKLARGERSWLVFDCLDLAATVYLNGVEVGRQANSFYPFRVEVTGTLKAGENTLVVQLESGLFHAAHRSSSEYLYNCNLTKRPWLRKVQSEHGWDWSPRLLNVGIHGPVRLEIHRDVRWQECSIIAEVDDALTTGQVRARVFVEGLDKKAVRKKLTLRVGKVEQTASVTVKPGMNCLEVSLTVAKPKLWWPVGHGRQPRYEVEVKLEGVGAVRKKVGFRHVRINQEQHPEKGHYFIVEVNRKPIFCKGGNFVPADLINSHLDRKRYQELIDLALESNFNMLRVWGGGRYETEDFYDLCDAKGVMVWQEFIFACSKYPATDTAFLDDVKREATYQIRRLAHRPSLMLWCGNNEMEAFNYNGLYYWGQVHPDHGLFHQVLPRLVREEDGTRYYHPSSPCSPAGEDPSSNDSGDQHAWNVGFSETDFRKYHQLACRFSDESGLLGPTALPTVRACADRIGSFAWEIHDNTACYWDWLPAYSPDRLIHDWTGRKVREMSIEDYVYWGGLVQGAGLAEYVKNFRRRMFDSAAAIFWMYNDVWPCTRSWTTVDYYRRRTPSFFPVKRAMAPVALVITREGEKVRVHGVNDGDAIDARLQFGILRLAGGYPLDEQKKVRLEANASTLLAEFDAARWDKLGQKTHIAFARLAQDDGVELARDTMIGPLFREMRWPAAKVRVRQQNGKAVFTSDTFAWRVCLDLNGETALPDNFFDIYPGIPTVLDWSKELGQPKVLRLGNTL